MPSHRHTTGVAEGDKAADPLGIGRVADVHHLQTRPPIRQIGVVVGHRNAYGGAVEVLVVAKQDGIGRPQRQRAGELKGVKVGQAAGVAGEVAGEVTREVHGEGPVGQHRRWQLCQRQRAGGELRGIEVGQPRCVAAE